MHLILCRFLLGGINIGQDMKQETKSDPRKGFREARDKTRKDR